MSTFTDVREVGQRCPGYNIEIFKEPRGIIRVLQLVFAVITAVVLRSYEGYIDINYCQQSPTTVHLPIEYPFNLNDVTAQLSCAAINGTILNPTLKLTNDFSCEARFLYDNCLWSIGVPIVAVFLYIIFWEEYESNGNMASIDFLASLVCAVCWISCVGYWGYAQSQLKAYTQPDALKASLRVCDLVTCMDITRASVSTLTQTLILSFLNFFLWAAGLWFIYKETPWYREIQRT